MDEVTIILNTPDAIMFRDFQKNYEIFKDFAQFHEAFALMIKQGVFDIRYGTATLHFVKGELDRISKDEIVWKKPEKK